MYEREDHGPPHVHVMCDKATTALITIGSLKVLGKEKQKLPPTCLKIAKQWIKKHNDRLMAFWWEARERQLVGNKP
jgi:hypothetical protein